MFGSLFFFCLVLFYLLDASANDECSIWLAPSLIEGIGRGIFAGRNFNKSELLDRQIAVTIPYKYLWVGDWALKNYVFDLEEEDHCMAIFGIGMLFNHGSEPTVGHHWDEKYVAYAKDSYWTPSTVMTPVRYSTTEAVEIGEELRINYGGDGWFAGRGIDAIDMDSTPSRQKAPLSYFEEQGFCITDVYIADSKIPLAGHGLYAKRGFKKGEIVTISPILALPAADIELLEHESVLQNYCMSTPEADVALLPIGYGALINHSPDPSVAYSWFEGWGNDVDGASAISNMLSRNVTEILEAPYSILDLQYVARRDIAPGEEITMYYGASWSENWALYLAKLLAFKSSENNGMHKPLFRRFIDVPDAFFPKHWSGNEPTEVVHERLILEREREQQRDSEHAEELRLEKERRRVRNLENRPDAWDEL